MTAQPPPPSRYQPTDSFERNLQRIRLRQDTEENWLKNDPIPASGELCYTIGTTDPGQVLKVGDGTVRWSNLPYLAATGASGPPGAPGQDGHGITVYGPSDSPPSPANTQLFEGDMWLSNGMWAKNPNFDPALITPGAKGDAGEIVGVSAVPLPTGQNPTVNNTGTTTDANLVFGIPAGAVGPQGIQGPVGPAGPQGPAGDTFKVSGAVANAAALPATPANLAVFITQDDSHLHIYDPASAAAGTNGYVDLGAIAGPQGQPTFYSNPVATAADLPATGAAGQCVLALDTGHMHSWNPATAAWVDAGQIRGPSGAGISNGTADGQIPVWSVTFASWQPTDVKIPKVIADLDDVDDVIGNLGQDCVMVWDEAAQVWTDSRSIEIDDIEFDASGPGILLEGIAAYSDAGLDPTKDTWVPSCMAVDKYIREGINLEYLLDCNELKYATNGQVPVWNDTTSQWEPQDPAGTSPIIYLGNGAWDPAKVNDPAQNYGMGSDTVPDPAEYAPMPGDQYIDLTTGVVTAFIGPASPAPPAPGRTISTITGGSSPVDAVPNGLNDLVDVSVASPQDGQMLVYSSASSKWENVATPAATSASSPGDLWMVGDIKESVLTEPQFKSLLSPAEQLKWALADGRDVTGSLFATTTGRNTIPDLRGAYLRMAGQNSTNVAWNGGTLNGYQEDATARPDNAFRTDAQGQHRHAPADGWKWHGLANGSGAANLEWSGGQTPNADQWTKEAGNHTHAIVSGGDAETRPKTYSVNYFIKIN